MSIATFVNWATNFISVFLFPWYVARFGVHTGFFLCRICLLATLFFAKSVPEDQGEKPGADRTAIGPVTPQKS
jgi:hypothetical protein